ncbi:hypothetical protein EVAR_96560_1 [Eumeta japonica]|uniref:Uncharacterized protein n=1 Tax=Eumeta variegata TaxID=151549 RepID=A0A4C1SSF8_EUMVA|nr:hypothetical protein EVAR_96560_1 [Eumeta japonica]
MPRAPDPRGPRPKSSSRKYLNGSEKRKRKRETEEKNKKLSKISRYLKNDDFINGNTIGQCFKSEDLDLTKSIPELSDAAPGTSVHPDPEQPQQVAATGALDEEQESVIKKKIFWRQVLSSLLDVTLTLSTCNLGFRGHREKADSNDLSSLGNFLSIVELLGKLNLRNSTNNFKTKQYKDPEIIEIPLITKPIAMDPCTQLSSRQLRDRYALMARALLRNRKQDYIKMRRDVYSCKRVREAQVGKGAKKSGPTTRHNDHLNVTLMS